jgi:cysteinyl-tRNA synthetase
MANVWMHNGFLMVEGQKMSKSLGNFFTIHQLLETTDFGGRKWPGEVLRLAMLMTHYREPIDFTVKRLEEAWRILKRWNLAAEEQEAQADGLPDPVVIAALADDLDSSGIVGRLHEMARESQDIGSFTATLKLLGLYWPDWKKADQEAAASMLASLSVPQSEIEARVKARLDALNAKDFAEADRIRNELAEQGIALMDYKDETGQRATKWEVKR